MNETLELQQHRAEVIGDFATELLVICDELGNESVRALAEKISTEAALIAEDCQIAMDAS
ncbi:hypothetical protein LRB11_15340 [Ectothiorhodospira haloalkaliphila]|uniref:hypothetical protein n=1 Tax=Ectothiorhodospira haloalkaliphila TaxID=421628 RepID=UPI001EE99FE3|nr:hypothetical protein [Ectothiorhodospira haloalkaliphila]MCG5526289.1 hypothetical protein [Ectothiorhodospira haloalkaliphila]